jgi:hypothetical protein
LNKNAAECKPACCSGRVFDVYACGRTTENLSDRTSERSDLALEFRAWRNLLLENGNENRQLRRIESRIVLRITITRKGADANPSLAGWRLQRAANSVRKRLRNVRRYRVRASDNFDSYDGHAA